MDELAALTVGTVALVVELLTQLSLVHRGYVYFLLQLCFSMGKCTSISVLAGTSLLPARAEFCLLLDLVVSSQDSPVVLEGVGVLV